MEAIKTDADITKQQAQHRMELEKMLMQRLLTSPQESGAPSKFSKPGPRFKPSSKGNL
jgi:hypothetical protein